MIKGLLFDLDGTIWDSRDAFAEALKETVEYQNGQRVSGKTLRDLLSSMTPLEILRLYQINRTDFFWKRYQERYSLIRLFFEDTHFTLQQVKIQKKIGVVTSLKKKVALDILAKFGLTSVFSAIVTPSDTPARKPSPKPLLKAMNELDLAENEVVYIGDQEIDIIAAKRAGCYSALAKWGNIATVTVKPDYQLGKLSDILALCGD
jgi:phosphoglycolate phosphatase